MNSYLFHLQRRVRKGDSHAIRTSFITSCKEESMKKEIGYKWASDEAHFLLLDQEHKQQQSLETSRDTVSTLLLARNLQFPPW